MITTMNYRNEKNIPFDDPNGQQFDYLETERLRLRKLTPYSIQSLYATLNDEELKQFFGIEHDADLVKEKQKVSHGLSTHNRSQVWFQMLLKASGEMIGSIGFHNWMPEHRRA